MKSLISRLNNNRKQDCKASKSYLINDKYSKRKNTKAKYSENQVFSNKLIDKLSNGKTWKGGTIADEIHFENDSRFADNISITTIDGGAQVVARFTIMNEDEANLVNEIEKLLVKYNKSFLEEEVTKRSSAFTDSQIEYLTSVKPDFTVREDQKMKF